MNELQVPVNGLQYRIYEDRLLGLCVCQQVGVGAALWLEQLNRKKTGEGTGVTQQSITKDVYVCEIAR